jgi:hypothetical protein
MTYWQRVRYNLRSTRYTPLTSLGFTLFFMALAALYSLFAILVQPTFGAPSSAAFFVLGAVCLLQARRSTRRNREVRRRGCTVCDPYDRTCRCRVHAVDQACTRTRAVCR